MDFLPIRTLFISDVHLGSRHSQCENLLCFIQHYRPESIYLLGDILDGWQLRRGFHWPPSCSRLVETLIDMADLGTRLYYCPGNHDEFWRHDSMVVELARRLGLVEIRDEFVFHTVNNRRLLVTHGDRFDIFETSAQWISMSLAKIYTWCLSLNWWCHRLRGGGASSPYRACASGKQRVKHLVRFLSGFERKSFEYVRQRDCEGIICGHLHTPAVVERDGLLYCNTGDWVEHCTALIEHYDGHLELKSFYPGVSSVVVEMPLGRRAPFPGVDPDEIDADRGPHVGRRTCEESPALCS